MGAALPHKRRCCAWRGGAQLFFLLLVLVVALSEGTYHPLVNIPSEEEELPGGGQDRSGSIYGEFTVAPLTEFHRQRRQTGDGESKVLPLERILTFPWKLLQPSAAGL